MLVIDGQQRLATITLLLEALSRRLGEIEPVDGFSAKKLRNYYLLNPLEDGERGFKLLLSQADLIRNVILMGLEPAHQTQLYEDHWRPMEVAFGQEAYGSHFDKFMRHYLTLKTSEIPNVRAVYEAFKAHAHAPKVAAGKNWRRPGRLEVAK